MSSSLSFFIKVNENIYSNGVWAAADYLNCVYPGVREIYRRYYMPLPTRIAIQVHYFLTALIPIELVGYIISLVLLAATLALLIRSKREFCIRNRIHICIELCLILQTLSRSSNRILQLSLQNKMAGMRTPDYISGICELILVIQNFSITTTFMLMLCEGIHLNIILNGLTVADRILEMSYVTLGGLLPLVITGIWTALMIKRFHNRCWASSNILSIYWMLRGTRLAAILINLILLVNTVRIIMNYSLKGSQIRRRKRKSQANDRSFKCISLCVKVAISLIPILGVVNIIDEIEYTVQSTGTLIFCTLALFQTLLSSLQGAIVSSIYYKSDKDMKKLLLKKYKGSVIDSILTNTARSRVSKKVENRYI
ncbi:hypothetical protein ACOME3_001669 [Neoechinorhynchus agilis]